MEQDNEKQVQWIYCFEEGLVTVASSVAGECELGDISADGARVISWTDLNGKSHVWRGVEFFINDKELKIKNGKFVNRFV